MRFKPRRKIFEKRNKTSPTNGTREETMGHSNKYVEKEFEVVGTRFKRPDGIDKVTGKARYGADATAPGVLVGRVFR